jgi:acetylornithine deacetylase/succinyl-diaminopimelate desuccinylase-like protein
MTGIDWEGALWATIAHLQALIRMDTVNPPGNEIGVARYLQDVLRGAGIETTLYEPAPGRAAMIGRLRGTGRRRPLLLLAHMDVVGVERARWTTNPFGGEILDGYLYGRGAIDDKGMLAVNLQTMLLLRDALAKGARPFDRDLIMVSTSDEEGGGALGIDWLAREHPEELEAEFALNEGGRIRMADGRPSYAAVQCAEKVPHVVRVWARGPGGHASIPLPDNAIGRLARAVAAICGHGEPVRLTDITRRFFGGLADGWPDAAQRQAMADVASDDAGRVAAGAAVLSRVPHFDAVLRNGVSPTLIAGGIRSNVIPGEANATLNIRTLPGESLDAMIARLSAAAGQAGIELEVLSRGHEGPPSSPTSAMFLAIEAAVSAIDPAVRTIPYLSTGATDSAALRRIGVQAYGLLPFPLTQEDEDRMHGHDERVSVSSLSFGVRLTYEIALRMLTPAEDAPPPA